MRVHHRRAGARAAGERQAGAALPDPQPQPVRGEHLGEADIGAFGKDRVVFQPRAEHLDRHGGEVGHEEGGVRVAQAGRRRIGERAEGEIEMERVGGPGERDVLPAEPCRPHVHRHAVRRQDRAAKIARNGADDGLREPGLGGDQGGDAAGGIAAGCGLVPVRVADPHEGGGIAGGWGGLDHDQLVAADAAPPVGERRGACWCQRKRRLPRVEHDKIVPTAVHLPERNPHGAAI